ncbi:hypothetical protein [uncultured Thiohalocapsa sp.]|uniref:hypothetical protein n=1 Tax=uncultured Thiohalocapsa sp. TaxID=768990 RepID=UPI0025D50A1F|nr:hypothetical protein [uncultured Thiohalocapsa sp.]
MPKTIDPKAAPGAAGIRARAGFEFARPQDIADHEDMSREHKIALLEQWEQDLREEMVAEEENMSGGGKPIADTLADVLSALSALGRKVTSRPVPDKHG